MRFPFSDFVWEPGSGDLHEAERGRTWDAKDREMGMIYDMVTHETG